jgi:hypothetical protein
MGGPRFWDLGVPVGPISQEKPRSQNRDLATHSKAGGRRLIFDRAQPQWRDLRCSGPVLEMFFHRAKRKDLVRHVSAGLDFGHPRSRTKDET